MADGGYRRCRVDLDGVRDRADLLLIRVHGDVAQVKAEGEVRQLGVQWAPTYLYSAAAVQELDEEVAV